MSAERLSKLQKWILERCSTEGPLYREQVYRDYFKLKLWRNYHAREADHQEGRLEKKRASVVLSRSLKRLKEKELISFGYFSRVEITNKGKEKALMLKHTVARLNIKDNQIISKEVK